MRFLQLQRVVAVLFAAALVLANLAAEVHAATVVGSTSIVVKTVTGTLGNNVRGLVLNDKVFEDELVETAAASASEITFLDETTISVGPNSRLTLDRFVLDPDPTHGAFAMTVIEGAFRFVSGNLANTTYVIHTPTATIEIRGTVLTIIVAPDGGTTVICESGVCIVANRAGATVTLDGPGLWTMVPPPLPDGTFVPPPREPRSGPLEPPAATLVQAMFVILAIPEIVAIAPAAGPGEELPPAAPPPTDPRIVQIVSETMLNENVVRILNGTIEDVIGAGAVFP